MAGNQVVYPTPWSLGLPRGSLKRLPNDRGYSVTLTEPDGKQTVKPFHTKNYGTVDNAHQEALRWRQETSDQAGRTRNQIRYLDQDTIEVQLTQGKTMKTDAKFLDKVGEYPLLVKKKKTSTGEAYYAMYQDKKLCRTFVSRIIDYDPVHHINGDQLDLRSCNLRQVGAVDKKVDVPDQVIADQYKYFKCSPSVLPRNIWLLGAPAGTIFKRTGSNIWSAVIQVEDGQVHTKTFDIGSYESEEEAKDEAERWKVETSYKLGLTKNLIRILDDETIEVKLTKDHTTKLDRCFIPLVQKIPLFTAHTGGGVPYCRTIKGGNIVGIHNVITGFEMVDHINRDTMDNRLINLRFTDHSLNNSNRTMGPETTGVLLVTDKNGKAYRAKIKLHGNEISKSFYVKTHGEERAKELATNYRKKILEIDQDSEDVTLDTIDDQRLITYLISRINELSTQLLSNVVIDFDSYLEGVELERDQKLQMYNKYVIINYTRISNLNRKLDKIKRLVIERMEAIYNLSFADQM